MKRSCTSILLSFLILFVPIFGKTSEGFPKGTPIKTPKKGVVPIETLKKSEKVVAYDPEKKEFVECEVVDAKKELAAKLLCILCAQEKVKGGKSPKKHKIFTGRDHKFYLPRQKKWVEAYKLLVGQYLLGANKRELKIEDIKELYKKTTLYGISVKKLHNYCVSDDGVVVHNFAPVVPIITLTTGEAAAVYTGAASVCAAIGTFLGLKLKEFKSQRKPKGNGWPNQGNIPEWQRKDYLMEQDNVTKKPSVKIDALIVKPDELSKIKLGFDFQKNKTKVSDVEKSGCPIECSSSNESSEKSQYNPKRNSALSRKAEAALRRDARRRAKKDLGIHDKRKFDVKASSLRKEKLTLDDLIFHDESNNVSLSQVSNNRSARPIEDQKDDLFLTKKNKAKKSNKKRVAIACGGGAPSPGGPGGPWPPKGPKKNKFEGPKKKKPEPKKGNGGNKKDGKNIRDVEHTGLFSQTPEPYSKVMERVFDNSCFV